MHGVTRLDAALASGFVLAAAAEATVLHHDVPGLLVLGYAGAPVLAVLAVRRLRPIATLCLIAGFALLGITLQLRLWPDEPDSGGVWMFALMLGCYSLGAHAQGRRRPQVLLLGLVAPLMVVVTVNVPTMTGWQMINGIVFVTVFIGVLPTAVGAAVRRRRAVLAEVAQQRAEIIRSLRAESAAAVVEERVRTTERLRPMLLDGVRELARQAETTGSAAAIETQARDLLGRTRREVLALTAPVPTADAPEAAADHRAHLLRLRTAAQPWAVLTAGALGAGLALESVEVLPLDVPDGVAVPAAFVVTAGVALLCWRPFVAVAATWAAALVFSHTVTSLDATLSGSALALTLAFSVAVLSTRRMAVAGLLACWLGAGLDSADPLGVAAVLLAAWLGGIALNEVSDLVEQTRENNRQLARHAQADARQAVADERLRLARELHDALGHSLTVIALQAGAARRLERSDPARAADVRRTLAAAAREGLEALDERDPGTPEMQALLDLTRSAGLIVDAGIDDLAGVDVAVRQVAERIVQESLTNVLRHAPGACAQVHVRRSPDGVEIIVTNSSARAATSPGSNRGLAGIRERATAVDGHVAWGPTESGGFQVRAHLPLTPLTAKVG